MSSLRNILPAFLMTSDGRQTIQQPPRITYRGNLSTTTLNRKAEALESSLAAAESHLSLLSTKVNNTLSAYEQHYSFLRRVAHFSMNSNVVLERNEALLAKREEDLAGAFEDLKLAIQVAGLKAKAQREEVNRLIEEVKGWRESADKNSENIENETRKRALETWERAERENGIAL